MTDPNPASAPTFETTPLEGGGFLFVGAVTLDRPIGAVWAKCRNIEKFVSIVLPGIASNFQWVDGGSPGVVPARFTFEASGAALLEEVYYRSDEDHVIKYQLVTPSLGIESYKATIALTSQGPKSTLVTYSREMRFADPSLLGSFSDLLQLEMKNLQDYFEKTDD